MYKLVIQLFLNFNCSMIVTYCAVTIDNIEYVISNNVLDNISFKIK